jgi:hypothetical protein
MSNWISRKVRAAFAVAVAAGLTFGAGAALASPAAAASCPYNPDSSQYGFACTSHASCTTSCSNYYGSYQQGRCYGGCCTCLL